MTLKLLKLPESSVSCREASLPVAGSMPRRMIDSKPWPDRVSQSASLVMRPGQVQELSDVIRHLAAAIEDLPEAASRLDHQRHDPLAAG